MYIVRLSNAILILVFISTNIACKEHEDELNVFPRAYGTYNLPLGYYDSSTGDFIETAQLTKKGLQLGIKQYTFGEIRLGESGPTTFEVELKDNRGDLFTTLDMAHVEFGTTWFFSGPLIDEYGNLYLLNGIKKP